MTVATVPSTLLREPNTFIQEVIDGQGISQKVGSLLVLCCAFFAVYGGVLGASSSLPQALISAVKLPLLFIITMTICFPTLHVLNLLFGGRQTVSQLTALLLGGLAATGTILMAFMPVSVFFLTTNDSYSFFKLLNVVFLAISASYGVKFFASAIRRLQENHDPAMAPNRKSVLTVWIILYAFVGSQLAWVTRPYFGAPNLSFEVFRAQKGNFYVDIGEAVREIVGVD